MPLYGGGYGPYRAAGAPVSGTDEVQTVTISASSGTFKFRYEGFTTSAITWTSSDATLIAAVDAALEALPSIGTGGVATATTAAALTSGVGTFTITFSGANLAKRAVSTIAVAASTLTGASATVSVAKTTTGVSATFLGAKPGAFYFNNTTGVVYVQTNTAGTGAVTWVAVGSQT